MRIGLLTDLTAVNSAYRGLPIRHLEVLGHQVVLGMEGTDLRLDALHGCDVVHIHRHHGSSEVQRTIERLREAGTAIVWDNDDDLTTTPPVALERRSVSKGAMRSQRSQAEMVAMLRRAHLVTTPSHVLAEQYRKWGAQRVEVVENFIPPWYAADTIEAHEGITIGWTAANEHRFDLAALQLREVLGALLDTNPHVRVASIGIDLALPPERYTFQPLVQHPQLAERVAAFDIGIAPIADIAFNRARSNVKLKEYAAVGVPWLASPIGPYADLGSKQGGELVPDDDWYVALDRLVRDGRRRRKLGRRGRKWAEGERIERNVGAWESAMEHAVMQARTPQAVA